MGDLVKTGNTEPSRKSFSRICFIHSLVKRNSCPNVPRLAEMLEVSSRTVERDLESLRDNFGAPLEYDFANKRFYYLSPFELPPVKLTEGEAIALVLGHYLMSQYRGTPFSERIKTALEKISNMLPETVTLNSVELDDLVSFDIDPPRGDEQLLGAAYTKIAEAVEHKCTLGITYYSAARDMVTQRNIDPYHLRYYQGAWYVVAYCHLRKEIRIFALDRIREIRNTNKSFTIAEDFSPKVFFEGVFGIEMGGTAEQVEILFDSYQARFITEKRWHKSQRVEYLIDGSVILTIKVSGLGEVKRWIMSFGSHAKVLAPHSLQQEIKAEVEKMGQRYVKE